MKTQEQIAEAAGITQQAISSYLNGVARPKWKTVKRLCKVVPGTSYKLWLDGTPEEIRAAIKAAFTDKDVAV